MKKLVSVLLALAMVCACTMAFAAGSIGGGDLNNTKTDAGSTFSIWTEDAQDAAGEIAALQDKGIDAYFGDAAAKAAEILGEGELQVNEFLSVFASDYDPSMGNPTVELLFATPYTAGDKVAVMIGIPQNGAYNWTAIEGDVTEDGGVQVTIPGNLVSSIQNGGALLAVINK